MKQIRKILEIKLLDPSASIRTIARYTQVSRPVVKDYLDRLATHPLKSEDLAKMNDEKLRNHLELSLPIIQETDDNRRLQDWLTLHITELNKIGKTRRILHENYINEHPTGLGYSQFCFVLNQRFHTPEASSLLEHKAGDKLYVDFTGHKFHWKDTKGQTYIEEIFVAVMGASSYLYSVPTPSQKQEEFTQAVQQSFYFFGGVPRAIVPDCLKSAVISHDGREPIHNSLFQRMLDYYKTLSIPARPKHPKDKPLVEGAVNLIYHQILGRMENEVFESRKDMLAWWSQGVERINNTPFQKLPGNRLSRFETVDKPELKPLPTKEFEITTVLNQRVTPTGVIYLPEDKTSYSVPYSLQGKTVEILVSSNSVEVWHSHERKVIHDRQPGAGKVICSIHRPEAHKWYADRNLSELERELSQAGAHVASWVAKIVIQSGHEDIAWRILDGMRSLIRKHPERIDVACRLDLRQETASLKEVKRILKKEEDLQLVQEEQLNQEMPFHENVRGPGYYSQEVGA